MSAAEVGRQRRVGALPSRTLRGATPLAALVRAEVAEDGPVLRNVVHQPGQEPWGELLDTVKVVAA